jgi:hypothetical protein
MGRKMKLWLLGTLAALLIIIAVGPIMVARIARHFFEPKPMINTALNIKAHGNISVVGGKIILTTPQKKNNYILEGSQVQELTKYANAKQEIYVFGYLKRPSAKEVGNTKIGANIEISRYDTKDFAQPMISPQEIAKNVEYRNQVLKKVGMNEPQMDVLCGKLRLGDCIIRNKGTKSLCLFVQDKNGQTYYLSNRAKAIKAPLDKFRRFNNLDMDVVVVGRFALPDIDVTVPQYQDIQTFLVRGLYNQDLSEFVVE